MDLSGRVVMIVGAGRGIGRAAAEMFAAAGADLVIASRTEAELLELQFKLEREQRSRVLVQPTDATSATDVERLVSETLGSFGRIDTLLYAAGVGALKPLPETSLDDFDRLMNANTRGAFLVAKTVLPVMERQRRGHVIAIPGILGRAPMAHAAAYCAAKFALTGMMKALALEYKRAGVRFSLLHFGGVNTSFWDAIGMRVQREKTLTAEAAARAVFFAATQEGEGVLNELVLQPESHQL